MSIRSNKKAISYEEINSDLEDEHIISGSPGPDIDDVLTDDLLESSDEEKPKKQTKTKKQPVKRAIKKKPSKPVQTKLNMTKLSKGKQVQKPEWNPKRTKELTEKYPDSYWTCHADAGHGMISTINESNPIHSIPCNMSDQAPITSMCLSPDGTLLATFSNIGSVKIWDIESDCTLLRKLRDGTEKHIDEFYCGQFIQDTNLIVVAGKVKDRYRWSAEDQDNHILPCPIKVFDISTSKVIATLEGHQEEILCIKAVKFDNQNYLVSTSQDGHIIKWHMDDDWKSLIESQKMDDNLTCMAFTVSFVPNTGNKYFMAATDEHLRLYDFETATLLQTFSDLYSSYCDCGKFVNWLDEAAYLNEKGDMDVDEKAQYAYFISRGAEMCDLEDGVSSKPNYCTLHKLVYPSKTGEKFKLEEVKRYGNEEYHANSWLVKITSNGRYILAPTIYGQIFVFNMLTSQVAAVIKEHQDMEVRDVIFHPYRPLMFSCGDDSCVKVYTYQSIDDTSRANIENDLNIGISEVKIEDTQ